MVGVRSLSISLSIALVVSVGCLIGSLTITNGNEATDDARSTGDRAVNDALEAGQENTLTIANMLLDSKLTEVATSIESFLSTSAKGADEIIKMVKAQDPDIVTNPTYIDTVMRRYTAAKMRSLSDSGVNQLGYFPLAFSPNSDPNRWGGDLAFTVADTSSGRLPANGSEVYMVVETRDFATGEFGSNKNTWWYGVSDESGSMSYLDSSCRLYSSFDDPEKITGPCEFPLVILRQPPWVELHSRALENIEQDSGPLDSPDVVHFSPLSTVSNYLVVYAYASWTHPDMVNRYSRQDNRVGFVKVGVTVERLSNLMANMSLINGSVLYAVEVNQWTGKTGNLVGTNQGKPWFTVVEDLGGIGVDTTYPINVTNFTDPVIKAHGIYVMESGGYVDTEPVLWNEYYSQIKLIKKAELTWALCLLIPRSEVMQTIDERTDRINAEISKSRQDSDDERDKNFTTMMIVTFVCAVLLIVIAAICTSFIIRPINKLRDDMAAVASMQLELVSEESESVLSEVRDMQQSFKKMVSNLVEYRNYIQPSILVSIGSSSSEETEIPTMGGGVSRSSQRSGGFSATISEHTGATSSLKSSNSNGVSKRLAINDETIKKRSISIVYLNLNNWHQFMRSNTDTVVVSAHADFIQLALKNISGYGGVAETFCGDRLMATFNSVKHCSSHRVSASSCGRAISVESKGHAAQVSYACASGESKVGNIGCVGMKKLTIFSAAIPWVVALERQSRLIGTHGVVDQYVASDASHKFAMRIIEIVIFKKRSSNPIKIYELMFENNHRDEEWMYQIESAQSSIFSAWNECWSCIMNSEWETARQFLTTYPGEKDDMYTKTMQIVQKRSFEVTTISNH
eukprot:TRINITY_DN15877_c0_g1_i1.p1 TRINITY_DN15877_c0_g1~~TRINITY_DN15877_c0_g1_i1.p1  ORF type:complete len:854 (+),score=167.95 TRINITY_DN15877_c0_g1_i1:58-2619(+)